MASDIDLDAVPVSALLLNTNYGPQLETHGTFADLNVATTEISGGDYARITVRNTGPARLEPVTGGAAFKTDDVTFTSSGTISDAKFMVLVAGTPGALMSSDPLIGFVDLDESGAAATISATNSEFVVQAPTAGWFSITRA